MDRICINIMDMNFGANMNANMVIMYCISVYKLNRIN